MEEISNEKKSVHTSMSLLSLVKLIFATFILSKKKKHTNFQLISNLYPFFLYCKTLRNINFKWYILYSYKMRQRSVCAKLRSVILTLSV